MFGGRRIRANVDEQKNPAPVGNQIPAVHFSQVILFTRYFCNCSL
jgi:hypothetical protein